MYINADSISQIVTSLCYYFAINEENLYKLINELEYVKDENLINEFIEKKTKHRLDKIIIYHLSRRLNSINTDNTGYNLIDLLTTKNEFTGFLKKYDLSFKYNKKYIEIYYKNKLINLYKFEDNNSLYLRARLGYNKTYKDFCFNGFILNPLLTKSQYISSLEECPEIIDALTKLVNNNSLKKEYIKESKYFCLKYLVPIQMVIINGKEQLNDNEKEICIVREYIRILAEFFIHKKIEEGTEMIIRFNDYVSISSKYYIDKFEITK